MRGRRPHDEALCSMQSDRAGHAGQVARARSKLPSVVPEADVDPPDDVTARNTLALSYGAKTPAWWNSAAHLAIDAKHYRALPHGSARKHAAQEATKGAYRKKGKTLSQGHTKLVLKSKYDPGALGINVLAGVGNGKVLMWEHIDGSWGGAAAEAACRGPINAALKRESPGRSCFRRARRQRRERSQVFHGSSCEGRGAHRSA